MEHTAMTMLTGTDSAVLRVINGCETGIVILTPALKPPLDASTIS